MLGQTVLVHLMESTFWSYEISVSTAALAVMKFSGLFEHIFVNQIKSLVIFISGNRFQAQVGRLCIGTTITRGKYRHSGPVPRAGTGVDGSKVIHAANVYRPSEMPPRISKDKYTELHYLGNDRWVVQEVKDGAPNVLRNYTTDDLRITIVYRGRCFENEEKANHFKGNMRA